MTSAAPLIPDRPTLPALREVVVSPRSSGELKLRAAAAIRDIELALKAAKVYRDPKPLTLKAADTTSWDTLHSWATESLVRLEAPEAVVHLIRRLDAEKAWQRRWAAQELAEVGNADAIPPLRKARKRDPLHRTLGPQAG